MFTIATMFKPSTVKFITSKWTTLAGVDYDFSIIDIDDGEENGNPKLREAIAGARAEALHELLKETTHF
jgi:hypothetical protein